MLYLKVQMLKMRKRNKVKNLLFSIIYYETSVADPAFEAPSLVESGRAEQEPKEVVPGNSSMPTTVKTKKSRKRELGKLAKKAAKKSKRAVVFTDTDTSEVNTLFV